MSNYIETNRCVNFCKCCLKIQFEFKKTIIPLSEENENPTLALQDVRTKTFEFILQSCDSPKNLLWSCKSAYEKWDPPLERFVRIERCNEFLS